MYTAHLTVDSRKTTPEAMSELGDVLYGTGLTHPRLPLPEEVIAIVEYAGTGLRPDVYDRGSFVIVRDGMYEDLTDPGTYFIANPAIQEDPSDPGTYKIGDR